MRIEVRTCIKCGEEKEIPQKKSYATNTCPDCSRKASREYQRLEAIKGGRRVGTTGRVPYPLPDELKPIGNYFKKMVTKTMKCRTREELRALMAERLDNALENEELMRWINAHDEPTTNKRISATMKDYPDTRNMTWEDYEKGLGDNEVDS